MLTSKSSSFAVLLLSKGIVCYPVSEGVGSCSCKLAKLEKASIAGKKETEWLDGVAKDGVAEVLDMLFRLGRVPSLVSRKTHSSESAVQFVQGLFEHRSLRFLQFKHDPVFTLTRLFFIISNESP